MLPPVTTIRSFRKTLQVEIDTVGNIIVRAPQNMPETKITDFLRKHQGWIHKNIAKTNAQRLPLGYSTFEHGTPVLYKGQLLQILFCELKSKAVEISDNIYVNELYAGHAKKIVLAKFKREALFYAQKRILQLCAQNSLKVSKIRISSARTRWGSCSGKDSISISWRLIMAPPTVMDYVIFHELAHVIHKNHSKKFWELVGQFDKNYKISEKWLKENAYLLNCI
jgi:predicted metal-dependent hydrolase